MNEEQVTPKKKKGFKIASIILNVIFTIAIIATLFFFFSSLSVIFKESADSKDQLGSVIALVLVLLPFFLIVEAATAILGAITLSITIKGRKQFKTKLLLIYDIVFEVIIIALFPILLLITNSSSTSN